jgi:hypothetical protein
MITDSSDGDFSRKVSQRTAVLIGADDEERLEIRRAITHVYGIRSKVAHGDVPPDTHQDAARAVVHLPAPRVPGPDHPRPALDVATVCDDALMSAAVRKLSVAGPVRQVVDQLPEERGMRARLRKYAPASRHPP